ncbi:MAG: RHS repeat protein [Lachnospiraceae bacterium]|nr:RHS repeat protein [Lachnospiraceae bacterium]
MRRGVLKNIFVLIFLSFVLTSCGSNRGNYESSDSYVDWEEEEEERYTLVGKIANACDLGRESWQLYEYDMSGNLNRVHYGEFGSEGSYYEWIYNKAGDVTEESLYNIDQQFVHGIKYFYDYNNDLVEKRNIRVGNTVDVTTYEYVTDSQGKKISCNVYNTARELIAKKNYEYDAGGTLQKECEYSPDNVLKEEWIYDSNGNLISDTYYFNENSQRTTSYEYDEQGNLIWEKGFNSLGETIYIYTNFYDENNNLLRTEQIDEAGNLIYYADYVYELEKERKEEYSVEEILSRVEAQKTILNTQNSSSEVFPQQSTNTYVEPTTVVVQWKTQIDGEAMDVDFCCNGYDDLGALLDTSIEEGRYYAPGGPLVAEEERGDGYLILYIYDPNTSFQIEIVDAEMMRASGYGIYDMIDEIVVNVPGKEPVNVVEQEGFYGRAYTGVWLYSFTVDHGNVLSN